MNDKRPTGPQLATATATETNARKFLTTVKLQARVENEEGGIVTLSVPSAPMASGDLDTLSRLFPNTMPRIDKLLAVESLLESIQ